jgi:hypothetical protein
MLVLEMIRTSDANNDGSSCGGNTGAEKISLDVAALKARDAQDLTTRRKVPDIKV